MSNLSYNENKVLISNQTESITVKKRRLERERRAAEAEKQVK